MAVNKFTDDNLDWDDLRFFARLAELKTLSAAARSLGVTHATVARRIERIEAGFGAPLFERRPSGYQLTHLGEALRHRVAEMQRASLAVADLQRQGNAQFGAVRVSVPRSIADAFVVPNLAGVRQNLVGVELSVLTETRVVSLARWETDIAIRLGRPGDGAIVARRVGAIRYRLHAHADAPLGTFVGYPQDDAGSEAAWLEQYAAGRPFAFRSNSQIAQRAAALAGFGTALLPTFLANDKAMRIVDSTAFPPDREIFILGRRDSLREAHIRTVFDTLVDLFRKNWPG